MADSRVPGLERPFFAIDSREFHHSEAWRKETFKAGAIDVPHKQLMAVAVALTTQCPYCIELHMRAAREAGANDTMLTEAAIVAVAMRANATVTHASHLFKD